MKKARKVCICNYGLDEIGDDECVMVFGVCLLRKGVKPSGPITRAIEFVTNKGMNMQVATYAVAGPDYDSVCSEAAEHVKGLAKTAKEHF